MMNTLWQDIRFGFRMMLKNPGFTIVVVFTLALGIGVNVTIFNFVNALLLRPPAVESPEQLVEVWNRSVKSGSAFEAHYPYSYPEYVYYRDHNNVFLDFTAYRTEPVKISWNRAGQGEWIFGQLVSGNFFTTLGIKPVLGRFFSPEEDQTPNTHPVVVLSHNFWKLRFGADTKILNTDIHLNGSVFTVIGIAPQEFSGLMVGFKPELWLPLMTSPIIFKQYDILENRGSHEFLGIGKLKPGITPQQAQSELSLLTSQFMQGQSNQNKDITAAIYPAALVPAPMRVYVRSFTGILQLIVAFVLIIACANVYNLFLAQATVRRREMAIRSAVGASRWRIIRQTVLEGLLVSVLSGVAGFLLANWTAPLLLQFKPASLPIDLDVAPDWRVCVFTIGLSLITGIVFGLILGSSKINLLSTLKEETPTAGHHRSRMRNTLVIAEVAICLVLLICGGLCLKSLFNAQSIDPGFQITNRLVASFDVKSLGYSQIESMQLFNSLLEEIGNLPGVASISIADRLPLDGTNRTLGINIEGHQLPPEQLEYSIQRNDVGPGFFQTMGTPILRGRDFNQQDRENAQRVAVINEVLADRLWPNQDPVGKRFFVGHIEKNESYEIIGIVKTGKYRALSEQPQPVIFRSFLQHFNPSNSIVIHSAVNPISLFQSVRDAVSKLDPNLAVNLNTMQQHLEPELFLPRIMAIFFGIIGLLGLILTIVGLSSVIAFSVAQRTKEIGIRMAVGARQSDVLKQMVSEGIFLTSIGIVVGLCVSFGLTRFLSNLLYGIAPNDPITFAGVSLLLAFVAFFACYIPARRAANVDPMTALRCE